MSLIGYTSTPVVRCSPRGCESLPENGRDFQPHVFSILLFRLSRKKSRELVVVRFDKEAMQARGYCVAKNTTPRADRPDPSLRKSGLPGMTIKLHH